MEQPSKIGKTHWKKFNGWSFSSGFSFKMVKSIVASRYLVENAKKLEVLSSFRTTNLMASSASISFAKGAFLADSKKNTRYGFREASIRFQTHNKK